MSSAEIAFEEYIVMRTTFLLAIDYPIPIHIFENSVECYEDILGDLEDEEKPKFIEMVKVSLSVVWPQPPIETEKQEAQVNKDLQAIQHAFIDSVLKSNDVSRMRFKKLSCKLLKHLSENEADRSAANPYSYPW